MKHTHIKSKDKYINKALWVSKYLNEFIRFKSSEGETLLPNKYSYVNNFKEGKIKITNQNMLLFDKESIITFLTTQGYHFYGAILLVLMLLYKVLYLNKYKFYRPEEKLSWDIRRANAKRGNPPPSYPNGWFRVCASNELKRG